VDPAPRHEGLQEDGWVVQILTGGTDSEPDTILARTLINASGLSSHQVLNSLLPRQKPPQSAIPIYYARGSYASYRGPGVGHVQRLIYPVPDESKNHSFQSLGTHLTLDMDGNVRFGPDVEWIEPPTNGSSGEGDSSREEDIDFWAKHLSPSAERIPLMHRSIQTFLPQVGMDGLSPDYVGIRPKLKGPGGGFEDFVLRMDRTGRWLKEGANGGASMVTLMGIESPGLTSSLAIAEMVVDEVLDQGQ
jgi:2-hydroxyglutarate dehydrogenase